MFIKDKYNDPNKIFADKIFVFLSLIIIVLSIVFYNFGEKLDIRQKPKEAKVITEIKTEIIKEPLNKSYEKPKPLWGLPFAKNNFVSIVDIVKTDNGYLIAGEHKLDSRPAFFVEVDESGQEIWNKKFTKNISGILSLAAVKIGRHFILSHEEDAYMIDKYSHQIVKKFPYVLKKAISINNDEILACDYHNKLYRFGKDGEIIWQKNIDASHIPEDIHYEYISDPKDLNKDATVVEHTRPADVIKKIIKTKDRNFILAVRNLRIFKFDMNGKMLFNIQHDENDEYFYDMIEMSDGSLNVLFSKVLKNSKSINIMNIASGGKVIWEKQIFESKSGRAFAFSLAKYRKDNVLVAINTEEKGRNFVKMIELDNNGKIIDQKDMHNIGEDPVVNVLSPALDGGVLVGGRTSYAVSTHPQIVNSKVIKFSDTRNYEAIFLKIRADLKLSEHNFNNLIETN
ncbi:hypothetical protein [Campylobacter sp. RM16188]|uniref:hypothetical protein n=1 Tax=Campylobacter sp. RM16188 TaxID=1705725 RepID=UPI001555BBCB|nr:hypothetical protein [Campylobacter sp. RM16188]